MPLSNRRLIQRANTVSAGTDSSFGSSATQAPLSIRQVEVFLKLAITQQAMLPDVRTVMSDAAKWEESKISFDGRIMRPGTQLTRLGSADRYSPAFGRIEINTHLLRGEVPVSDEVLEDQVEREGFGNTIIRGVAEAAGRDIEDLMLNGDSGIGDAEQGNYGDLGVGYEDTTTVASVGDRAYYRQFDGWLQQSLKGTGANVIDAGGSADYQEVFAALLATLPDRYKRDKANMRFYVPDTLEELYRDTLGSRGTPLGDRILQGDVPLKYQGVDIKSVPLLRINPGTIAADGSAIGSDGDRTFVLLTHRHNLYAGFQRQIRMETWRDPREGGTSFLVTTRVDAKVAHVPATAVAKNVNIDVGF